MGYNKKILSQATAGLNKAKAPAKKKDRVINPIPLISNEGFKQGPPPEGTNYRIPSNTIYNPTPYDILARASTGEERIVYAGDTTPKTFKDATHVDEFQLKKGGQKKSSKKYSRSITATNRLFDKNPLFKKPKSKKKKIFDPNAKYYQTGGNISVPELTEFQDGGEYLELDLTLEEMDKYRKGGYIVEELPQAQTGRTIYVDPNDTAGRARHQLKDKGLDYTYNSQAQTTPKNNTPTTKPNQKVVTSQEEYDKQLKIYLEAKKRNAMMKASAFGSISKLYDLRNEDYTHPVVFDEDSKFKTINDYLKNAEKLGLEKTGKSYLSHLGYPLPTFKEVKPYFQEFYDKQQQLIDAGYDIGTVDGILGPKSKAAWEEFQAQQNAPQQIPPYNQLDDAMVLPLRKPELLQTPKPEPNIQANEQRLIKRYNPNTNTWELAEVAVNSASAKYYDEREEWRLKNKQIRPSSHMITDEERQKYEKDKQRKLDILAQFQQGGLAKAQDGGQKDKWGRSLNDKWYGFDPQTKKYTIAPYKIQELRNQAAGVSKYDPLERVQPQVASTTKVASTAPKKEFKKVEERVANDEALARYLEQSGKAELFLGDKYWDQSGDQPLRGMIYDDIRKDPDIMSKIDQKEYERFLKEEQEAYSKATPLQKGTNALTAFISDPVLTTQNLIFGNNETGLRRPLVNQKEILNDPDNPMYSMYSRATGYDNNLVNKGVNILNPGKWTAQADIANKKGNYADAYGNLFLNIAGGTGLSELAEQGAKQLPKLANRLNPLKTLKQLPGSGNAKFTTDFEDASFLVPEKSYFTPQTDFEKELANQAEEYFRLKTSPENFKRARELDAEFGTQYTQGLQDLITQKTNQGVAQKYPFNIRVENNPGEGAGAYSSLTEAGALKKEQGMPTTIDDREIVIYGNSPIKDIRRRAQHEMSHHTILGRNNDAAFKNKWGEKLKNALDNPGEISKTNPVLADKLIQKAFPNSSNSKTLFEYLSDPAEVDAYLNTTLRDDLVQRGILQNQWDTLDENKLALYFMDEGPKDRMVDTLLDIVKPSEFLEIFNKGVYVAPAAITLGAAAQSEYKDGGIVIDLDDESQIQNYINQGYIVEFDEGGFVPKRQIKLITETPKELPAKPVEKVIEPVQQLTSTFKHRDIKLAPSGMTEYSKSILANREKIPIEELQKRYLKPEPKPKASTAPLEFSGIANLKNRPEATPAFMNQPVSQPIAGGIGSQFSNVGQTGVIDQKKLSNTEKEIAKLNKKTEKLKEVIQPSFLEKAMKSQAQAFQGPDVYKATEEVKNNPYFQYLERVAVKEGLVNPNEAKVKINKTTPKPKINSQKSNVDEFYQEIASVPDNYTQSDSLISYRNQWNNDKGFEYIATPVKKDRDPNTTYKNVKGVGHFLLDASANPNAQYSHEYNKSMINKSIENNEWIPTFQPLKGDRVKLQYKKPSEILKTDQVVTPLRQMQFSDIRFDKTKRPEGFKSGIKEVMTNDGQGTYLIFKDRDGYSRFSGGSVVFIFKDKFNNTIVRDFAGSLNQIENEGLQIQKQYNLKPKNLTIGYHDVGSFSAKPKANSKGELKASQWEGYNPYDWTGGALLIPKD